MINFFFARPKFCSVAGVMCMIRLCVLAFYDSLFSWFSHVPLPFVFGLHVVESQLAWIEILMKFMWLHCIRWAPRIVRHQSITLLWLLCCQLTPLTHWIFVSFIGHWLLVSCFIVLVTWIPPYPNFSWLYYDTLIGQLFMYNQIGDKILHEDPDFNLNLYRLIWLILEFFLFVFFKSEYAYIYGKDIRVSLI